MTILLSKGIFATIGEIERSIIELAEYLNVEFKNREKFGVIYERLLQKCPKLHTDEEHKQLSEQFVNDFIAEFSHRELRIWFEVYAPMTFGDETLQQKYYKLLDIHNAFVSKWMKAHNLLLRADAFLFGNRVRDAYRKVGIGFANSIHDSGTPYTTQLWGIIKTIRDSGYQKEVIMPLQHSIKVLLEISGGSYYNTLDLTKKENLKELYYVLCEVLHTKDGFQGSEMFHSYDGYGGVIFDPTGEVTYD